MKRGSAAGSAVRRQRRRPDRAPTDLAARRARVTREPLDVARDADAENPGGPPAPDASLR